MTHGSLFSGIGGFDLAAQWMGWENMFHCEWNEFGQKVLKHYWPDSVSYNDINHADFTIWRGKIDVLSGGFPCQPYSQAGKRLGKEDDRHLWPQMLRAIREIQPSWVVGENVLGLVNWSGGLVFEEVQTDLEAEGYEVQSYVLPAVAKNAPHIRQRVWIVAHTNCHGQSRQATQRDDKKKYGKRDKERGQLTTYIQEQNPSNNVWDKFRKRGSPQSPVCSRDDGISDRLVGITFPKWRNESIKAYGNAIVPQVVFEIFKTIEVWEDHNDLPF